MIIQCHPPIKVYTPHGEGYTLFLIDYGINLNTQWVVALTETNKVRHYDANDIRVAENYTIGLSKPPLPLAGEDGY